MDIDNIEQKRTCLLLLLGAACLVLKQLQKKQVRRRAHRRWWVRPINRRKRLQGDYYNLYKEMRSEDPDYFFNYTRMSIKMFDELLQLVKDPLTKTSRRPHIPAECRLLITLRYLASGDCLQSVANAYRMGKSTVCVIIQETCLVIWNVLQPLYMAPLSEDEWKNKAVDFGNRWNLPNCIGAIDGKHIAIKQPNNSGSLYFNYKKHFSIVLFGACDTKYKFSAVDIGAYGSQSDGGVLRDSTFGQKLNDNTLGIPQDTPLPGHTIPFPYYFVGDDAFPLKNNIMKPFSGRNLPQNERIYNYRVSRARRCIENTFGILAARWRIFHKTIHSQPETVDKIVKACTCLHNYIMTKQEEDNESKYCNDKYVDREINNTLIEGAWREEVPDSIALRPIQRRLGARNAQRSANEYRQTLMHHVNNEGSVSWQIEYVNKY